MSTETTASVAHTTTTTKDLNGEHTVSCSCGWAPEWFVTFDTKLEAMGAGDRHVATAMDRAAWAKA